MKGPHVLRAARFPSIRFRSREVTGKQLSAGSYALSVVSAAVGARPLPDPVTPEPPGLVADAASIAGRFSSGERTIELDAAEGGLVLRFGPLAVRSVGGVPTTA